MLFILSPKALVLDKFLSSKFFYLKRQKATQNKVSHISSSADLYW